MKSHPTRTFTKLDDGEWGVRIVSREDNVWVRSGKVVSVTRKNGTKTQVTLGERVKADTTGTVAWYQIQRRYFQ